MSRTTWQVVFPQETIWVVRGNGRLPLIEPPPGESAERRAASHAELLPGVEPARDRVVGGRVEAADGRLVALAVQHPYRVSGQVNVGGADRRGLAD